MSANTELSAGLSIKKIEQKIIVDGRTFQLHQIKETEERS